MTLEKVFKKTVSHSAAELQNPNPVPGPSLDVQLQPKDGQTMVTITTMTTLIYPLPQDPQTSCFALLLHASIFSCV